MDLDDIASAQILEVAVFINIVERTTDVRFTEPVFDFTEKTVELIANSPQGSQIKIDLGWGDRYLTADEILDLLIEALETKVAADKARPGSNHLVTRFLS